MPAIIVCDGAGARRDQKSTKNHFLTISKNEAAGGVGRGSDFSLPDRFFKRPQRQSRSFAAVGDVCDLRADWRMSLLRLCDRCVAAAAALNPKPSNEAGGQISAFPTVFLSAPDANPDRSPPSGRCAMCRRIGACRF